MCVSVCECVCMCVRVRCARARVCRCVCVCACVCLRARASECAAAMHVLDAALTYESFPQDSTLCCSKTNDIDAKKDQK